MFRIFKGVERVPYLRSIRSRLQFKGGRNPCSIALRSGHIQFAEVEAISWPPPRRANGSWPSGGANLDLRRAGNVPILPSNVVLAAARSSSLEQLQHKNIIYRDFVFVRLIQQLTNYVIAQAGRACYFSHAEERPSGS